MSSTPDLYAVDLKALGIKDRDLSRHIGEVKRLREQHATYAVAAEKAHRAKATLPERLRDEAAAALTAGDEPKDEAKVIAEVEQGATIADARVAAAGKALRQAEQALEAHLSEVGADHRATIREAIAAHRADAVEAVDTAADAVGTVLDDLTALLQMQPVPGSTVGGSDLSRLPSKQRRNLGVEYAQHRVHELLRQVRAEVEALLPPSEEAFAEGAGSRSGYLHRPQKQTTAAGGIVW